MISAEAKDVVAQSSANRRISMIVTVDADIEMRDLKAIPDFTERGARLKVLFARKKQPLLAALSEYENAGLRIVSNSSGAPNVILSAPARVWKRVIREQPLIENNRDFRVEADAPDVFTTARLVEA